MHDHAVPTRALLTEFDEWHRRVLGVPAVIHGGKDAKLIAGLCRSHGAAYVSALMADFFMCDDPWIERAGFSVGVFVSQAPKLIARRPRVRVRYNWLEECQRLHGGSCNERARHMIEMAKVEP